MSKSAAAALLAASALLIAPTAMAADLIVSEPAPMGVVDVSGRWDGPFVGVFGGYSWSDYSDDTPVVGDVDGWFLGVNAGANFSLGNGLVVGVVGDIAWSDGYGVTLVDPVEVSTDWLGSLRGRVGFDGGSFMPYLTAGLAAAGVTLGQSPDYDTQTMVGWTAGAGIEFAATDSMSIDLLYRYSDYGSTEFQFGGGGPFEASLTSNQVSVGLNWSF